MSLQSAIKAAETKVASFFQKEEAKVESLFSKIAPVLNEAQAIVAKLDTAVNAEAKQFPTIAPITLVANFLNEEVKDATAVQAFVAAHASVALTTTLHDAAVFVISKLPAASALVANELDTAVQVAYSVLKA